VDSLWTPHGGGLEWMRTRDRLGMDWTRSGWTTGGLQQDSMSIGGLHVDSHRIPGGVKYTGYSLPSITGILTAIPIRPYSGAPVSLCPCPRIFALELGGVIFGCGWLGLRLGCHGAFREGIVVHVVCLWMQER